MEKTKLYILSGFLGAGKTTLLQNMIEKLEGQRIGVIQNELGKVGIDGDRIRDTEIEMVELNRGSIFCTCLKLQFVQALAEMTKQHFDYLLIESSGYGDPSNVEEILEATKIAAGDDYCYDFKGVVALVDCLNFLQNLDEMVTVRRQIRHCHMAILTKTDLVSEDEVAAVKAMIREINPVCPIRTSFKGILDQEFLGEDLIQFQWAEAEESTNSISTKPKTLSLDFKGAIKKESLQNFLEAMVPECYRIKGFFEFEESGWHTVDVVGSQIVYEPCEAKDFSQIVLIAKNGNQVIRPIVSNWDEYVGLKMKLNN